MQFIEGSQSLSIPRRDLIEGNFNRLEIDPNTENPIRDSLNADVFGQPEAVEAITSSIMRSEAGFTSPNRPKGVFFFLGPTGVGKTEMAKALTRHLYPNDWIDHFKRVDCTDYQDSSSINRIKGSPNSYVGYGDPVLIMPDFLEKGGVIVFDEIEKAHRSLYNWLLPVMEEGSVTVPLPTDKPAANGAKDTKEIVPTTLDFTKAYLIMTSNVGADAITDVKSGKREIGFGPSTSKTSDIKQAAMKALRNHFVGIPEFLGRIGEANSVVFKDLGPSEYDRIFDKFLGEINNSQTQNAVIISTTEELRRHFIYDAMNGKYGARTLRNQIDREIIGQAAELKYLGQIKGSTLIADIDDETKKVFFWSTSNASASKGHSVQIYAPSPLVAIQSNDATIDEVMRTN